MKQVFLAHIILLFSLIGSVQNHTIDVLIDKTRCIKQCEYVVDYLIDQALKKTTKCSSSVREMIHGLVDYNSCRSNVRQVYLNTYSEKEIGDLLSYLDSDIKRQFKNLHSRVEGKLYLLGVEFG